MHGAAAGDPVHESQAKFNRSTRQQWKLYASHRREVERLLAPYRRPAARLCVLGAGNCNDLDLQWLTEPGGGFGEVHLVDIDAVALERAVARQGVADSPAVRRHAPVDLTAAAADAFDRWRRNPPSPADIEGAVRRLADAAPPDVGGPVDVVLSPCVLSQLINPARDTLPGGEHHPRFRDVLSAIRARHLRTMAALLAPGGRGVLVTDLVSSGTFAHLSQMTPGELPGLMRKLIDDGNFFSGLAPQSLAAAVKDDSCVGASLRDVEQTAPWLWHLAPTKTFLVYATCFRKSAGDGPPPIVVR